jgi:hypothetical protein
MLPKPITPRRIPNFLSKKRAQKLRQRRNHQQHQHDALKSFH